jgi:hypothetical protein
MAKILNSPTFEYIFPDKRKIPDPIMELIPNKKIDLNERAALFINIIIKLKHEVCVDLNLQIISISVE